jgi:prepilin-type N-terminal cleavage/methylation domain-containing protein
LGSLRVLMTAAKPSLLEAFAASPVFNSSTLQRKHCVNLFTRHNVGSMHPRIVARPPHAFTLIELLVVIAIIIILAGLLYPAYNAVQSQAKRTQAKNDLTQIVNAVNAYYTEYGKYPLATADTVYGPAGSLNDGLFYTLRAVASGVNAGNAQNPRVIVFVNPPYVKDPANPRSGIGTTTGPGQYYDPWGKPYVIKIDGDYDNQLANPYSLNAGAATLQIGVIAWSFGKDTQSGSVPGPAADKNAGNADDDVISWQ